MSDDKEMNIQFDLPKNRSNVIKAIGVGGGGSNAINHMYDRGITGVDFVVCNTDAQALDNSPVPTKIQLGVNLTEGLGAGANPEIGEQAALESFDDLKELLDTNTKMLFVTAGMGGGTGTGAAPIIAKQARDMDILTVGIVTIPFKFEGRVRSEQAQTGIEKLRQNVDSLIIINNDKLREVYGNLGFKSGFSKADEVLATASRGIAEVITHHYTQNIDLRDAKTVLSDSGTAIMGSASATGESRAQDSIKKALDSPLLNDNKITGANNVLLLIVSGSEEITLDEIGEINDHIQSEAGNSANIIMGVGEDESLDKAIAVTIIATGFDPEQQNEISDTEDKKIIHTLEDEQKAVQSLSPKNSGRSNVPSRESNPAGEQDKNNPKRVIHELDEKEDNPDSPKDDVDQQESQEPELISNEELIKDLEVDYRNISYTEEDFVFLPNTQEEEESKDNVNTDQSEPHAGEESGPMFQFDFPKAKSTDSQPEKSQNETSSQQTHRKKNAGNIEVDDEIELFPGSKASGKGKRYSLEDYMEKERELTQAKPQNKKSKANEPQLIDKRDENKRSKTQPSTAEEPRENTHKTEKREIDPMTSPISKQMADRASQRRARMKKFNYKFKKNNNIEEIEKQPAYKRAGIDLEESHPSGQEGLSRTSLKNDSEEDGPQLRSNNSFLHDNVD